MERECSYILPDGTRCGKLHHNRRIDYCEEHHNVCYNVALTAKLRRRKVERLADLVTVPRSRTPPSW